MQLSRFIKLMLVLLVDFSAGGNYMGAIDCLCICVLF